MSLVQKKEGAYVHVCDGEGGVGGRGSLIETRPNIRFRSRIVKLLRNKSHSFHMTSPPYENVSFSGFKN